MGKELQPVSAGEVIHDLQGSMDMSRNPGCQNVDQKNRTQDASVIPYDADTDKSRLLPVVHMPYGQGRQRRMLLLTGRFK